MWWIRPYIPSGRECIMWVLRYVVWHSNPFDDVCPNITSSLSWDFVLGPFEPVDLLFFFFLSFTTYPYTRHIIASLLRHILTRDIVLIFFVGWFAGIRVRCQFGRRIDGDLHLSTDRVTVVSISHHDRFWGRGAAHRESYPQWCDKQHKKHHPYQSQDLGPDVARVPRHRIWFAAEKLLYLRVWFMRTIGRQWTRYPLVVS